MNQKNVAFIMDRLPLQKGPTIRLVLPGLDNGWGVVFEAHFPGQRTQEELDVLLDKVVLALPGVVKLVEEKV